MRNVPFFNSTFSNYCRILYLCMGMENVKCGSYRDKQKESQVKLVTLFCASRWA